MTLPWALRIMEEEVEGTQRGYKGLLESAVQGLEGGGWGGGQSRPERFPRNSVLPKTQLDALWPEEVRASCGWMPRSSQPAEWAGMGEQSITASK